MLVTEMVSSRSEAMEIVILGIYSRTKRDCHSLGQNSI